MRVLPPFKILLALLSYGMLSQGMPHQIQSELTVYSERHLCHRDRQIEVRQVAKGES